VVIDPRIKLRIVVATFGRFLTRVNCAVRSAATSQEPTPSRYVVTAKASNQGGVMVDLNSQIARLDMLAKQLAIHLQGLARNAPEAASARSELYALLQGLAQLKAERERREALLETEEV
jgi:hypothetical protein